MGRPIGIHFLESLRKGIPAPALIRGSQPAGQDLLIAGGKEAPSSDSQEHGLFSCLDGPSLSRGLGRKSVQNRNDRTHGGTETGNHKGLTGKQGVLIPEKNVNNLMLRRDVVEAVEQGKFHIYPVTTVEEGIEILTGMEAGEIQEDGTYPEGTLYRKVDDKLQEMAEMEKEFGKGKEEDENKDE